MNFNDEKNHLNHRITCDRGDGCNDDYPVYDGLTAASV